MTIPSSVYFNLSERQRDQTVQLLDEILEYNVTAVNMQSGSITTANAFGTSLAVYGSGKALAVFAGTWTATASLQVSLSTATSPATWHNLSTYSTNGARLIDMGVACSLRIGIPTGSYTAGTLLWNLKTGGR
jgi:hypothetical protein